LFRSILGVLVGFGVILLETAMVAPRVMGLMTMPVLLAAIGGGALAALVAGFLTAWIAGRLELRHVGILCLGIVALAAAIMIKQGSPRPDWYETALVGCAPMAAMVGGAMRLLVKPTSDDAPESNRAAS
jgi:hypothetical protein